MTSLPSAEPRHHQNNHPLAVVGTPHQAWTGAEPFLVGIAPNFWAHTPMTIADVHQLKLVHGVHCFEIKATTNHHHEKDHTSTSSLPSSSSSSSLPSYVPVSKCLLVGVIVSATIRSSDEARLYVLDDGTGFMDCLVWSNDTEYDRFQLPLLVGVGRDGAERWSPLPPPPPTPLGLGDVVRVFGKMQVVSVQQQETTTDNTTKQKKDSTGSPSTNSNGNSNSNSNSTIIVREILASRMERVDPPGLNEEARHWQRCADRAQAMVESPTDFNAVGYLTRLGPHITAQVRERRHLPAAEDTVGAWRVFGPSCDCVLDYKEELLYCHCRAKVEPLDPELSFRDALLRHLLVLQAAHAKKLVFPYKGIKINPNLREIASTVISLSSSTTPTTSKPTVSNVKFNVDRLILNTFRALRQDGIVYLTNPDIDEYLLISRRWVLEPYIRNELEAKQKDMSNNTNKNFIDFEGAPYLSKAHYDRLLYIKRSLAQEKQ